MSRTVIFHRLAAPTGASVKRRTVWLPAIFAILVLADAWAVSNAQPGAGRQHVLARRDDAGD